MSNTFSEKQKSKLLSKVGIAAPCEVQWNEMDSSVSERVRFCDLCKKNVYNISAMSADEVVEFLANSGEERPCIKYYKRADGTLITDNCPVGLRKSRDRFKRVAVKVLLGIGLSVLAQKVQAQGLIGAPIDPKYGQYNGGLTVVDNNLETAKTVCSFLTIMSLPVTCLFGVLDLQKTGEKAKLWYQRGASQRVAKKLITCKRLQILALLLLIPLLIHFVGIFVLSFWTN